MVAVTRSHLHCGAVTLLLVFAWPGCGGLGKPPGPPRVDDCASGWNVTAISGNDTLMMPRSMTWAQGVLYEAAWSAVLAVPADGSVQQTLVADVYPTGIWAEGNNVLYSAGNQLLQVARTGGNATVIVDGGPVPDPSAPSGETQAAGEPTMLDAAYFYWSSLTYDGRGTLVSRIPRVGGTAEVIAELPLVLVGGLAVVPDGVLAAGLHGNTYSAMIAPFDGGSLRVLASGFAYGSLLSVEPAGTIWRIPDSFLTYALMLSPSDGSPTRPLATTLPDHMTWEWASPDGNGGHFLSARERFDDGTSHRSIFFLSASGSTTRLACEPVEASGDIRGTALSPDALYLTINRLGSGWSIVRVPIVAP